MNTLPLSLQHFLCHIFVLPYNIFSTSPSLSHIFSFPISFTHSLFLLLSHIFFLPISFTLSPSLSLFHLLSLSPFFSLTLLFLFLSKWLKDILHFAAKNNYLSSPFFFNHECEWKAETKCRLNQMSEWFRTFNRKVSHFRFIATLDFKADFKSPQINKVVVFMDLNKMATNLNVIGPLGQVTPV